MTTTTPAHDSHAHPRFLAHHFDTPQQQFDSGKLGIWLFLTTEILLFSGLFCAYAVYRATHPEVFEFAHLYLDKTMGAINTIVLIFSSFTMAWAVRSAQLGDQGKLKILLALTILCGGAFMVVKYFEYAHKFHQKTLWGANFAPTTPPGAHGEQGESDPPGVHPGEKDAAHGESPHTATATAAPTTQPEIGVAPDGNKIQQSKIFRPPVGSTDVDAQWVAARSPGASAPAEHKVGPEPANTQLFFSVYFLMTGLHGLHVLGGMAVISWLLVRSFRGDFGPDYFNPVDFVGLYWHVVDLVWIFLFPLLYLIA